MRKADIDPLGEQRVMLDQRTGTAHKGIVLTVGEKDHVRIAHGNRAGRVHHRVIDRTNLKFDAACVHFLGQRDLLPLQTWLTHVDPHPQVARAAGAGQTTQRIHRNLGLFELFQHQPTHAAQCIAAGLDHGAVGIPHPHKAVRVLRTLHRDQLIKAPQPRFG